MSPGERSRHVFSVSHHLGEWRKGEECFKQHVQRAALKIPYLGVWTRIHAEGSARLRQGSWRCPFVPGNGAYCSLQR